MRNQRRSLLTEQRKEVSCRRLLQEDAMGLSEEGEPDRDSHDQVRRDATVSRMAANTSEHASSPCSPDVHHRAPALPPRHSGFEICIRACDSGEWWGFVLGSTLWDSIRATSPAQRTKFSSRIARTKSLLSTSGNSQCEKCRCNVSLSLSLSLPLSFSPDTQPSVQPSHSGRPGTLPIGLATLANQPIPHEGEYH